MELVLLEELELAPSPEPGLEPEPLEPEPELAPLEPLELEPLELEPLEPLES